MVITYIYTCKYDDSISVVVCDTPPSVDNADMDDTGTAYTNTVTYMCHKGYKHVPESGALTRTCQADGRWSGDAPICQSEPNVLFSQSFLSL